MKRSLGTFIVFLLTAIAACAQVAKLFPGGSPPMDKASLRKLYDGIESQLPKRKAEAQAMQPRSDDAYALGKVVEVTHTDLLKTLDDLRDTLKASVNESFRNPGEVAFVECRVKDDIDEISGDFDSYAAALDSSSTPRNEEQKILIQQMMDIRTYGTDSRLLRIDLENRLHDMAMTSERTP